MPVLNPNKEAICPTCKEKFKTSPKHIKYCSMECRRVANQLASFARSGGVIKECECKLCKCIFETRYKNDYFCTVACREEHKRKEKEEKWVNKKERKRIKPWRMHREYQV